MKNFRSNPSFQHHLDHSSHQAPLHSPHPLPPDAVSLSFFICAPSFRRRGSCELPTRRINRSEGQKFQSWLLLVRIDRRGLSDADGDDRVRDGEFFTRRVEEDILADGDDQECDGGVGSSFLVSWLRRG